MLGPTGIQWYILIGTVTEHAHCFDIYTGIQWSIWHYLLVLLVLICIYFNLGTARNVVVSMLILKVHASTNTKWHTGIFIICTDILMVSTGILMVFDTEGVLCHMVMFPFCYFQL